MERFKLITQEKKNGEGCEGESEEVRRKKGEGEVINLFFLLSREERGDWKQFSPFSCLENVRGGGGKGGEGRGLYVFLISVKQKKSGVYLLKKIVGRGRGKEDFQHTYSLLNKRGLRQRGKKGTT